MFVIRERIYADSVEEDAEVSAPNVNKELQYLFQCGP